MDNVFYIKISVLILLVIFFIIRKSFTLHYKTFTFRLSIKYIVTSILMILYFFGIFDLAIIDFAPSVQLLGVVLIFVGYCLFYFAHKNLSINWSPVIEKKFTKSRYLVKTGPYKYLIHPIYSASIITLFGFLLFTKNWLLIGIPLVILVLFYCYKIPKEEKELRRNFGKSFDVYFNERKRFIPLVW